MHEHTIPSIPPFPCHPSIHPSLPLSIHSHFFLSPCLAQGPLCQSIHLLTCDTSTFSPLTWGLELCCRCWRESAFFFFPGARSIFSFLPMNLRSALQGIWKREDGVWRGGGEKQWKFVGMRHYWFSFSTPATHPCSGTNTNLTHFIIITTAPTAWQKQNTTTFLKVFF